MSPRIPGARYLALAALLLTGGCGDGSHSTGLVERELSASEKSFRLVESSAERFRYQSRPSTGAPEGGDAGSGPQLVYDTPEGWQPKAGSMMRDINFSFGENGEGECYLARLPGAGGGLAANVNRWRAQMGADPLPDDEIAKLPTKILFGQPAVYVSVDGPFTPGMGTTETFADYRLIGVILASDAGAVFVKMTGPKDLVAQNEASFEQFVQSIDVKLN